MLNFIYQQTQQYEAYTDRYLAFKVQFRKEIPFSKKKNKQQVKISVDCKKAINAIETLLQALVWLKYTVTFDTRKLHFLDKVKSLIGLSEYKKREKLILSIDEIHWDMFCDLLLMGVHFEGAFFSLDTMFQITRKTNLDTRDVFLLLPDFVELNNTIKCYER